jgi:hypothetical protein
VPPGDSFAGSTDMHATAANSGVDIQPGQRTIVEG